MKIFASIHSRMLRVSGFQHSGWSVADEDDSSARELPFDLSITEDGAGGFLLVYRSSDGLLSGDTSHRTFTSAVVGAERQFGIMKEEWGDTYQGGAGNWPPPL